MKNTGFSKREPWRVAGFSKREPWRVLGSLKGNLGEWLGSLRDPLQGSLLESPGFFTVARRNGIIRAAELANKGPFLFYFITVLSGTFLICCSLVVLPV